MSNVNASDGVRRTIDEYMSAQNARNTSELGKTDFLNLLVAQLANQDPLEPAKDTEFIAQLAQFSTLEQMQMLSQSYANSQASSMIGKYIEGSYTKEMVGMDANGMPEIRQSTVKVAGLVSGLTYLNGQAQLQIQGLDGYTVKLSNVEYVMDYEAVNGLGFNSNVLDSSGLIGKYVKAEYTAYEKNADGTVNLDAKFTKKSEGYVDRISVEAGIIYAHVGEDRFDVRSIYDIGPAAAGAVGEIPSGVHEDTDEAVTNDPVQPVQQTTAYAPIAGDISELIASMDAAALQSILMTFAQNIGIGDYNALVNLILTDPALLTDGMSEDGLEGIADIGPDEFGSFG